MSAGLEKARSDQPGAAILLMLGAVMCFTGIDTCAKYLVQTLPPMQVVFFRYLGHFIIVAAIFLPLEGRTLLHANRPKVQIARAVALLGATLLNFLALQFLPLAVTSAIFFASPLIICALSVPFLGEQVGPRRWAAIAAGFIGILIIVRPGLGALHWAWLLSIASTFCAAVYMILTRMVAGVDSTETSLFYTGGIATIVMLPFALAVWVWPDGAVEIALCTLIGIFGMIGHQMVTVAHRFAPASTIAPFSYIQIIWMTASGYVVFGNVPDIWVFAGAAIVTASGLYMWLRERRLGKATTAVNPPPK